MYMFDVSFHQQSDTDERTHAENCLSQILDLTGI